MYSFQDEPWHSAYGREYSREDELKYDKIENEFLGESKLSDPWDELHDFINSTFEHLPETDTILHDDEFDDDNLNDDYDIYEEEGDN